MEVCTEDFINRKYSMRKEMFVYVFIALYVLIGFVTNVVSHIKEFVIFWLLLPLYWRFVHKIYMKNMVNNGNLLVSLSLFYGKFVIVE